MYLNIFLYINPQPSRQSRDAPVWISGSRWSSNKNITRTQTAWVSSSFIWSQLDTRCRIESQRPTEGIGSSVTHGWATQPRWERSAAMVRRTLGQYEAVCSRLRLTSYTQPTSTPSRIKCERYIFIKNSFVHWSRHYCWLCFRIYLYMCVAIQHF